jgi:hypothetical protein
MDVTKGTRGWWFVLYTLPICTSNILPGVKIYGFASVSEDAGCGVCVHEIGHLGNGHSRSRCYFTDTSQYLAGLIFTMPIMLLLELVTGA